MKLEIRPQECMLLALLHASLKEKEADTSAFKNCTSEDWENCYKLSTEQGVMALAWDGILTLPEELMPPKMLKLKWALGVETYEKTYERYCRTVSELTELFAAHGIATTQFKGVGFSTYYPVPQHREGGDIDIYTFSTDHSRMSDIEANELAEDIIRKKGIEVIPDQDKHNIFFYNGIPVENHKSFINVVTLKIAEPLDKLLRNTFLLEPTGLMNGRYRIYTPDKYFNSIFIPFHAAQHYGGEGLTLHHLCDWACLLNRHGIQLPEGADDPHFLKILSIFTEFTNRFLGTDIQNECSEKELERVYREIFRTPVKPKITAKNSIGILYQKTMYLLHLGWKKHRLFGEPRFGMLRGNIIAHYHKA